VVGFEPTFENGGYWEYYKDLERQFESFLEYVPFLDGNENTYSFRLANLILSIGAHIDSAFKEVAKTQPFTPNTLILENADGTPKKKITFWITSHSDGIRTAQAKSNVQAFATREDVFLFINTRKSVT